MNRTSRPTHRRRATQTALVFRTHGGRREGAGRKPAPGKKPGVAHRRRFELTELLPVHVTLRMAPHVYNLRAQRAYRVVEKALRAGASRFGVGLVQYSVQGNHIHLIVEARRRIALARSIQVSGKRRPSLSLCKREKQIFAPAVVLRTAWVVPCGKPQGDLRGIARRAFPQESHPRLTGVAVFDFCRRRRGNRRLR